MFVDPQSVTISAVAQTLPRTGVTLTEGVFTKDDGNVGLRVSHSGTKGRKRHLLRLDFRKIAADPFTSGINTEYTMSVYTVIDVPLVGFTIAEQKAVADALVAYLTASTGARITQLLGGEV